MAKRGVIALSVVLGLGLGGFALVQLAGEAATEFRVEGQALHVAGPISGAASDRLQRLLEQHPELEVVVLGDIPGADSVGWVAGMGRMIRAEGLETRATGTVVNDAILLFLGGETRTMAGGALVLQSDAVQRRAGVAVDVSTAAQADRERFVAAMLGDAGFATFMAEMRATRDSHAVSTAELGRFGLETAN